MSDKDPVDQLLTLPTRPWQSGDEMHRRSFILLVLAMSLTPLMVWAQPSLLTGDVRAAEHPRLATAPDGSLHLVFQGRQGTSGAIGYRTWSDGVWSDEQVISTTSGNQFDPAIAVAGDGTVHVVWTTESGSRLAMAHRMLRDGVWSVVQILDAGSRGHSEFPSIAAREDGGAEVAWQIGQGVTFQIVHASIDPNGVASAPQVLDCQSANGFNVYPQIFLIPIPVICWYEAVEGDFLLHAAEVVPGPEWRRITIEDLLMINTNHLPYLLMSELGQWAAIWNEAEGAHDRIALSHDPGWGLNFVETVDTNPNFDNVAPDATAIGEGLWAVAWAAGSAGGDEIYLAIESPDDWLQFSVSQGLVTAPAQPAVGVTPGLAHVVWTSDAQRGGSGSLCHATVSLR